MKRILCSLAGLLLCAPLLASAAEGWVVADISLQAGPDTGYPSILMLEAGEPVSIQGCIAGWTWCDVIAEDDARGWVPGTFLEQEYRGHPVVLIDYGARIGIPVLSFSIGAYWDRHYHNRQFYAQRQRWESRSIHAHAPPRPSHIVATAPRPHGGTRHESSVTQQDATTQKPRTATTKRTHNADTQVLTQEQRDRRRQHMSKEPPAPEQRHARAEPQPAKPTDTAPQMVPQERPTAKKPQPQQRPERQVARNDKSRDEHQAKQHEPKPKDELSKPNRKQGKDNKDDDDNGGGRR